MIVAYCSDTTDTILLAGKIGVPLRLVPGILCACAGTLYLCSLLPVFKTALFLTGTAAGYVLLYTAPLRGKVTVSQPFRHDLTFLPLSGNPDSERRKMLALRTVEASINARTEALESVREVAVESKELPVQVDRL